MHISLFYLLIIWQYCSGTSLFFFKHKLTGFYDTRPSSFNVDQISLWVMSMFMDLPQNKHGILSSMGLTIHDFVIAVLAPLIYFTHFKYQIIWAYQSKSILIGIAGLVICIRVVFWVQMKLCLHPQGWSGEERCVYGRICEQKTKWLPHRHHHNDNGRHSCCSYCAWSTPCTK